MLLTARNSPLAEPGAARRDARAGRADPPRRARRRILGGDVDEALAPGGWGGPRGDGGYGGGHSAWEGQRYFEDEAYLIPHAEPGLLTMANRGVGTNASQFYITVAPCPHLDGRSVAFGRVTRGMDVVHKVHDSLSNKGRLIADIRIEKSGLVA